MFKKLIAELDKLDGMKVSIPIEPDKEGYLDKECPDEDCLFYFKVYEDDWVNIFKDESVYCPSCGKTSTSDNYSTTNQEQIAEKQIDQYIDYRISKAMKDDAANFNRRQPKGGLISIRMKVGGKLSKNILIPIPSREIFEQKIKCAKCHSRYSVIGSAFFCPSCGYNSVEQTFNNTINKIEASIKHISTIRGTLNKINKDESENICQTIIDKGLIDCVVAFQRFCDVMYSKHRDAKSKIPVNAFQNIDTGEDLWKNLFNESYSDWLSTDKFHRLKTLYQRRHLLQHTEGLVDQKYLDRSFDNHYQINDRITIKKNDVIELVGYIKTLSSTIKRKVKLNKI